MIRQAALAAALLAGTALPLRAQVAGLPVFNNGVGPGFAVGVDFGFNDDEAGGGMAFGGTGMYGSGTLGFTGPVSRWSPDAGESITSMGGTANLRVLGGPLSPVYVHLQAGVGTWDVGDVNFLHVPVGVGVGLVIPSPAVSFNPWIAPRLDLLNNDLVPDEDWASNFGISAGIDAYLVGGLGFRAAYDYVSGDERSPGVFSLGANYAFGTPSL